MHDLDDLDDLLRTTFRAHEDEAPDVPGLATAARGGHARRTAKRRQLMAVGTAGVLAVGGSTALALARHGSASPAGSAALTATKASNPPTAALSPGTPTNQKTAGPLPVSGSRAWSSHGLQVRVPAAWEANQTRCGTPVKATVIIDQGFVEDCLIRGTPVDVVEFESVKLADLQPRPALRPTTVGDRAAETGTERLADGRTVTVLIVPDLDVAVVVKSEDPDLVAGIVASAEIVDHDANGCPSRVAAAEPAGPPARPGALHTMVPGKPAGAVVCHYGAALSPDSAAAGAPVYLGAGTPVPADQLGALTKMLNTLKPGLATWQGLAGACTSAAHEGYLIRFTYSSGLPVDVYLHTDNCDHMGFDNGAVTGYVPSAFVNDSQKYLPDMGISVASEAVR